jgi:hypothetical protein
LGSVAAVATGNNEKNLKSKILMLNIQGLLKGLDHQMDWAFVKMYG